MYKRQALNSADEGVHFWSELWSVDTDDYTSQQGRNMMWWIHFSGTYAFNLIVPLVFMTRVFSGLKQDVMELLGGARYRNERVQDTVHSLRALLARLKRNADFEQFVDDLMCQKYIDSSEFMLMDYASRIKPDADTLEMSGLTLSLIHISEPTRR